MSAHLQPFSLAGHICKDACSRLVCVFQDTLGVLYRVLNLCFFINLQLPVHSFRSTCQQLLSFLFLKLSPVVKGTDATTCDSSSSSQHPVCGQDEEQALRLTSSCHAIYLPALLIAVFFQSPLNVVHFLCYLFNFSAKKGGMRRTHARDEVKGPRFSARKKILTVSTDPASL
jgi:hypothetical protein